MVRVLIAGGADLLLIETVFDTFNAKVAIFACEQVFDEDAARGTVAQMSPKQGRGALSYGIGAGGATGTLGVRRKVH